jgi:hypothetical protein
MLIYMITKRKTVYINSDRFPLYQVDEVMANVIKKRDNFLDTNKDVIAEIIDEKIDFIPITTNNHLYAVITLAYYPTS